MKKVIIFFAFALNFRFLDASAEQANESKRMLLYELETDYRNTIDAIPEELRFVHSNRVLIELAKIQAYPAENFLSRMGCLNNDDLKKNIIAFSQILSRAQADIPGNNS